MDEEKLETNDITISISSEPEFALDSWILTKCYNRLNLAERDRFKLLFIDHSGQLLPVNSSEPSGLQRQIVRASSFKE